MSVRTNVEQIAGDLQDAQEESLSIGEVVRRNHDHLLRWLKGRLAVPEDAYDIAQEAYIRMLKYEGARDIRSPRAMLQRIAMNLACDLGRSHRARQAEFHSSIDEDGAAELVSPQPSLEQELLAGEKAQLVARAIESLPGKCKQVFLLSRVHGMTYPQIARHCGISVKMVEKHISHALRVCIDKSRADA